MSANPHPVDEVLPVPKLLTLGLQLALIYVPLLQPIFQTAPLTGVELGACLGLATVVFVTMETSKWWRRRRPQASPW